MLCGNYILSNRSEWTFYFLSSVQFNFTIGGRILFTLNESKVYFVWTYGFTKFPTKDQRQIRKMNLLTDQLGQLAELIHNQLVHNREKNFIGRRNERHEVQ